MKIKTSLLIVLSLLLSTSIFAGDVSLDDLINRIQGNQKRIKDMYAETTTIITSTMSMPGSEGKGPQKMTQKGKMWTKGEDKSKIEMISPMKQVTITNGDKMAIINSETGQKIVQDLKKLREKSGMPESSKAMSLDKAKEFFNLSTSKKGGDYVITGVPKKENKFLGKMEFYVDTDKWVPVKILMYDARGKLMSQSDIEYQKISDIWIPAKNKSVVNTPAGRMDIEMEFGNIKINRGISDREFAVE